ncbi:MAG TPA: SURF1 family protein [Micromonosporaceae bacterium]
MYRFLFTPRWLGILALTLAAAAVMVLLGNWQLARYQERSSINHRIETNSTATPAPLTQVLPGPGLRPATAGAAPKDEIEYTRVTVTGRYDDANIVLVRGRSVSGRVGFEVLTPLVLSDGSAVLVNRGWVPPAAGGAMAQPQLPPTPTGEVTVTGLVRLSERRAGEVSRRDGRLETRRIAVSELARALPYPIYGGYLSLTEQDPPADPAFVAVPLRYENNWQNGAYAAQWWLFALAALVGFGWLVRREAHDRKAGDREAGASSPESATLPS